VAGELDFELDGRTGQLLDEGVDSPLPVRCAPNALPAFGLQCLRRSLSDAQRGWPGWKLTGPVSAGN
jgi:hypothetical protein